MKTCNTCKVDKPCDSDYYPVDKRNRSGLGGQCRECRNKRIEAWQTKNREKIRAAARRWKARNPERVQAYSARYWADHKEERRAYHRKWLTTERNSYYLRLRRDRKRGARGYCSFVQHQARWAFYGGLCYICGEPADTIDHVIPLARGGTEWPANLRPACKSCNSSKGTRRVQSL